MKGLLVALISVARVVFASPFVAAREIPVLSPAQNQQDDSQMEFGGNSKTLVIEQDWTLDKTEFVRENLSRTFFNLIR